MSASLSDSIRDVRTAEYDAETIRSLSQAPEYVRTLTRDGASHYIDNAHVEMRAIVVDDLVLPLVINATGHDNADVCSPYSHFVRYTFEELVKRNKRIPAALFRIVFGAFGSVVNACHIDRVVYFNNWLFPTNPHQTLSSSQVGALTTHLKQSYPRHAIVHRNVNPYLHRGHFDALRQNGYMMVKSRTVYLLDVTNDEFLKHDNARRDLHFLSKTPYSVVSPTNLSDAQIRRLTELYRSIYLEKHSRLNPQLNDNFHSMTFREHILSYKVLENGGRIDAFVNYYTRDGVLTGAFLGYDRTLPQNVGLYRMAFAVLISEAKSKGLLLNLSAGAGAFKVLRGAFPIVEYDAVYDRHLPTRRRLAWRLVWMEGRLWSLGL